MSAAKKLADIDIIKTLEPFSRLNQGQLDLLADYAEIRQIMPGQEILARGQEACYLLSGEVQITTPAGLSYILNKQSDKARFELFDPETTGEKIWATKRSSLIIFNKLMINGLTQAVATIKTTTNTNPYNNEEPWLNYFLDSTISKKLPAKNLQAIIENLQLINIDKGDIITQEGDSKSKQSNWFYIIKNGRFRLNRRGKQHGSEITIAELGEGEMFGEDATGERLSTVTALSSGELARVDKQCFKTNILEPIISYKSRGEAKDLIASGAQLIAIGQDLPVQATGFDNVEKIPINTLREVIKDLDPEHEYLIHGNESEAEIAVFLLLAHGLNASIIDPDEYNVVPLNMDNPGVNNDSHSTIKKWDTPPPGESAALKRIKELESRLNNAQLKAEAHARNAAALEIKRLQTRQQNSLLSSRKKATEQELTAATEKAALEAKRAHEADRARRLAEVELEKLQKETEKAQRKAAQEAHKMAAEQVKLEAKRAHEADKARRLAEEKLGKLQKETEQARRQAEQEARQKNEILTAKKKTEKALKAARTLIQRESQRAMAAETGRFKAESLSNQIKKQALAAKNKVKQISAQLSIARATKVEQQPEYEDANDTGYDTGYDTGSGISSNGSMLDIGASPGCASWITDEIAIDSFSLFTQIDIGHHGNVNENDNNDLFPAARRDSVFHIDTTHSPNKYLSATLGKTNTAYHKATDLIKKKVKNRKLRYLLFTVILFGTLASGVFIQQQNFEVYESMVNLQDKLSASEIMKQIIDIYTWFSSTFTRRS